jgi:hypothetical protein
MTESSGAATGAKARFQQINPHFVVRDVVEAAEYYRDVFGFKILGYYWDPPVFAVVGRDDVVIQFGRIDRGQTVAPNRTRRDEALDAYIWVNDLDALFAEMSRRARRLWKSRSGSLGIVTSFRWKMHLVFGWCLARVCLRGSDRGEPARRRRYQGERTRSFAALC